MIIYVTFLIVVCGISLAVMWDTMLMNMRLELAVRYAKIDVLDLDVKRLEDSKSLWNSLRKDIDFLINLDNRVRRLERSITMQNQYPPLNDIVS